MKASSENSPKNSSFNNTALIWDAKTREESAYKTNQGLPVRATFASQCEALDDAAVKAKLYTKESMTCDGSKEVPDDPEPTTSDKDDTDSAAQPEEDASDDAGKEENPSDSAEEDDDSGCTLTLI